MIPIQQVVWNWIQTDAIKPHPHRRGQAGPTLAFCIEMWAVDLAALTCTRKTWRADLWLVVFSFR